jgi:pimeloyl-ACP methyl ester carboxylesterase
MNDEDRRGFRAIGNLTMPIVSSPENLASTLARSQPSSETTGPRLPVAKPPGSIGTRRSATPAASMPADIVVAMASSEAESIDKLVLASLPPSVARSLTPVLREWNDPDAGFDFEIIGYAWREPRPGAPDLDAARAVAATAMVRAPAKIVMAELLRLAAVTKSRAESEEDQAFRFAAFRDELAEFPEDVVRTALRKIGRREKFFPSLADLRDQCQREFRHRKLLVSALEGEVTNHGR